MCLCAARQWQPLSAVPTLWARPRAVIELGGGRLPRHSPLGGGRAAYEGVQQPWGLELGRILPHSHVLPASPALSLALCAPCSTSQSRPPADKRIHSGRIHPQAAAAASAATIMRVLGPSGRRQYLGSDDQKRNVFVVIFGCDRHSVNRRVTASGSLWCASPRSGAGWGVSLRRTMKGLCTRFTSGGGRGVLWVRFLYNYIRNEKNL